MVTSIGGVFLYARDVQALAQWYRTHLGIETENWGSCRGRAFRYRDAQDPSKTYSTTWAIFPMEGPLEGALPATRTARVNYRVADLAATLSHLKSHGVEIEKTQDEKYGKFAWIHDPEGNYVELFEEVPGSL